MTPELWYLFYTTILLTVLWIPHIIGQVMTTGLLTSEDYKNLREQSQFPAWVRRANRAHINLVEQYGAFAGLVVIAHLAGVTNGMTVLCCAVFFWARIVHAIVMLAGIGVVMLRTLVFTVAFLALLVFGWQILMAA